MRERRLHMRPDRFGTATPAVMGFAFGFGWTPCVGPILAAILAVAGSSGSILNGVLLLGAFSAGLGIPFVLSGLGMATLFRRLKKWLRPINIVSGTLLIAFGIVMVTGRIGLISGWFSELLIRIGLEEITVI
jgi:cytochrome c-type biogenesis protein